MEMCPPMATCEPRSCHELAWFTVEVRLPSPNALTSRVSSQQDFYLQVENQMALLVCTPQK